MCPHLLAMKKFRVYIIGVILSSSRRSSAVGSLSDFKSGMVKVIVAETEVDKVVREPWIAECRKQGGTDRETDPRSRSTRRYRGIKRKCFEYV
ncbi:hypothetical protein FFLO_04159 [Filobasidium floriforme]|uniref:Uncharacterized protein n=1 Tax=Filobasidium floriforme TaxID=5210 RepID=A0A8K0JLG1_9TREE|nr:uncharacterized protein HD553DRAFT_310031 [Filobasidium floriforme]KAG7531717.1 hypothetical protein FFLO_04159 [Filobasidium floriforme]KAH8085682.1 hypothetical protein HD553DRAFT_310031 [Filobasidium floriforme]